LNYSRKTTALKVLDNLFSSDILSTMKNKIVQFKTVKEIEKFLKQKDSGTLDNLWENITDEFDYEDEAETCVSEFNRAIKRLKKLVS
jgi:hypothetical protein